MGQEIGTSGRIPKNLTIEQMRLNAEAAQLKVEGKSYREIAAQMGCDVHTAHDRVQKAIAAVPVEAVEELRVVELARLDEMLIEALRQLRMDHVMVSHGKVVPGVVDEGAKMAALDRLLRISESRRRLLGLDLPVKVSHEVTVYDGDSELDREIDALLAKFGSVEQGTPALAAPSAADPADAGG